MIPESAVLKKQHFSPKKRYGDKKMSKFLEDFAKHAEENGHYIFRVSEIDPEGIIETKEIRNACDCLNCYSIAKVFSATAIGILEDEGLVSTDELILDIFPEYNTEKIDPRWKKITVDMVLRHHCGFCPGDMDIDRFDIYENFGHDFLGHIFSKPLDHDPDDHFSYSDAAYYLISRVVSAKCNKKLDEYLWDKLFWPLGFQEVAWSKCPMGYPMGATGLYIKTRDMVKLGLVYMNKGLYKGQRILSERWINKALEREYDLYPTHFGNAFWKGGMFGQELVMIPESGRCVGWHASQKSDTEDNLVEWVCNYGK